MSNTFLDVSMKIDEQQISDYIKEVRNGLRTLALSFSASRLPLLRQHLPLPRLADSRSKMARLTTIN